MELGLNSLSPNKRPEHLEATPKRQTDWYNICIELQNETETVDSKK